MKRLFLISILLLPLLSMAQDVTNVRFEQDGMKVKIYYDLSAQADISIYLSTDGGRTYESAPLRSVTGAVGKNVSAGKRKCAVWDVLNDRDEIRGESICFKIAAINSEHLFQMAEKAIGKNQAFELYRQAAEMGHAKAQNKLGDCYYNGTGVDRNTLEAVKWYRKAANQGNAEAQYNLGLCYQYGVGVSQSDKEAKNWFGKSAKQGYAFAIQILQKQSIENLNEKIIKKQRKSDFFQTIAIGANVASGLCMKEDEDDVPLAFEGSLFAVKNVQDIELMGGNFLGLGTGVSTHNEGLSIPVFAKYLYSTRDDENICIEISLGYEAYLSPAALSERGPDYRFYENCAVYGGGEKVAIGANWSFTQLYRVLKYERCERSCIGLCLYFFF